MSMHTAKRTHGYTESVIRMMTRLANEHGAINLSQGFPNFPAPDTLKIGASRAIYDDVNQYAITWGAKRYRDALAAKYGEWYGMDVDPEKHLTITCGATEACVAVLLAIVDPGEEVIVLEPFYENYGPDAVLCDAHPIFFPLEDDWSIDFDRLRAAFSERTRAIIINTPNNPTGKVFTRDELEQIASLCREFDAYAVTDEVYEHITFDGAEHVPMATLAGMRDRTITISSASKTYSVTGWRIGTIVAPAEVSDAIRKVHDFLTVGAAAPLQEGVAAAVEMLPASYYAGLAELYQAKRDAFYPALLEAGFTCEAPAGSYFILADFSGLSDLADDEFSMWLTREVGVTPVPGSSFYSDSGGGRHLVRWAFCKTDDVMEQAVERLLSIRSLV